MSWAIVDWVLDDLDTHLARPDPEQGGALLTHTALPGVVVQFVHDPEAEVSTVSYRCSPELAALVATVERSSGLRLAGIAHSHPGLDRPSSQDHRAFHETLTKNPWMGSMLAPIVTQLRADRENETRLDHGKASWFEVRSVRGGVDVRPTGVRIVPLSRDLAALGRVTGIGAVDDGRQARFVLVGDVAFAMVDLVRTGDATESASEAVSAAGNRRPTHLLFPAGYPWQPPIALVPSPDGDEHEPVTLPWDLGVSERERLVAAWVALLPTPTPVQSLAPVEDASPDVESLTRLRGLLDPLADSRVLVVGAGSVGSFLTEVLVRHGVDCVTLVDPDTVQAPNLSRSVYRWDDLGAPKVQALARRLGEIRPGVNVSAHACTIDDLGEAAITDLLASSDLVVGATDDVRAHGLLNAFAWQAGVPAVYPALYREARAGEIVLAVPRPGGICWRCTVLGAAATSDGERPHDYGTGRVVAATALGADIWTVTAAAAKLCLALLHIGQGGEGDLARFVAVPLAWGSTLLQLATSPSWGPFDDWFRSAPGQWAFQSVWSTPVGDSECPVCGHSPTVARIHSLLSADQQDRLAELVSVDHPLAGG